MALFARAPRAVRRFVDPEVWLVALCASVIAFACLQILLFSFGRDQAIYAMVGDGIVHGKVPYRDVWDFKPPGIFFVHALAQALFGRSMLAPRLLEALTLLGTVWAMRSLGVRLFGSATVGWLGAALSALIHAELEFWHSGQPETFGAFFTLLGLSCATSFAGGRRALVGSALSGALFGAAFLLKPPLGGGALVVAFYVMRREAVQGARWVKVLLPGLVVGVASLLPTLACLFWFDVKGALPALEWTLGAFAPGYTQLGWGTLSALEAYYLAFEEAFFAFSALLPLGVGAALFGRAPGPREREGVFLLLGVVTVHLAGIALQGKYFQYHYAATLPLIALVAGVGFWKLWNWCRTAGPRGILLFASIVTLVGAMRTGVRDVPGTFWQRSLTRLGYLLRTGSIATRAELDRKLYYVADYNLAADREVAGEVVRRTDPGDPLFVWGFEPTIYWLAERPIASRFIYNVAQRTSWGRDEARQDLAADLTARPPRIVVVQHNDVFPAVTGDNLDSYRALAEFVWFQDWLTAGYHHVTSIEDFDLWEAKAPDPPR